MKHVSSFFFILLFFISTVSAGGGCSPNAPTGTPGLSPFPDSLPCIERDTGYYAIIHIENLDSIPGVLGGTAVVNYLRIDSITHLPSGINWQANNGNNTYLGGETGCIELIGTTHDTVGTYQLGLYITIEVNVPGFGNLPFSGEASLLASQFGGGLDFSYFLTVINQGDLCRITCTTTMDTVEATLCAGDSVLAGGAYQYAPGYYVDSLLSSIGCDSLIITHVMVISPALGNRNVQICAGDSVFAGGAYQQSAGSYVDTLVATSSCDSILTTHVSVLSSFLTPISASICDGDHYFAGGTFQTSAGVYYDTLSSAAGCDSIIETTLSIISPVSSTRPATICPGDSLLAGGAYQTLAGTYYDTLLSSHGCDSVVVTVLTLSNILYSNVAASICTGDSYFAGGQLQTTSGIYYDTVISVSGCDSVIITDLTVSSSIFHSVQIDLCNGDSYFAGGAFQITSGTYYDTLNTSGNCDSIVETVLSVHANPMVSFTALKSTYCSKDSAVPLTGTPTSGNFNGTGLAGNSFDPSIVPAGITVSVTYSYMDSFGCTGSQTQFVQVLPAPSVSFGSIDAEYCMDHPAVTLRGSPAGGSFIGPGVSGANFIPFYAGAGTHHIGYTVTGANGCTASLTRQVKVNPVPMLAFGNIDSALCANQDSVILNATPAGGVFSGPGVVDTFFFPILSGIGGPFIIEYIYTDSNGCQSTINLPVSVHPVPQLTFVANSSYCLGDDPVTLHATPPGGSYTGPGIFGNLFIPDSAGLGSHRLIYTDTIGDCSNAIVKEVQVTAPPQVTFILQTNEFCYNDPAIILSANPAGGTFSGNGISGNSFTPAAATVGGPYTLTYQFTNSNGCSAEKSVNVTVHNSPVPALVGLADVYCENDAADSISGIPAGGDFIGAGISGNIFDPVLAGRGTHTIYYSYTDTNGCNGIASKEVVVGCTGISSYGKSLDVQVFPNPFSGQLFVQFNAEEETRLLLRLVNLLGREIVQENNLLQPGKHAFHLSFNNDLPEGIYILELSASDKIFRQKLVKGN